MNPRFVFLRRLLFMPLLGLIAGACAYTRREMIPELLSGPADVIIVPGYELDSKGRGKYILWNRMVMAKLVLERGDAHTVIVSGGVPKAGITEAAKMHEFGLELGIPADQMILEPNASSSVQNGQFSADLMLKHGFESAILVSDPAHLNYAVPVFRDAFRERDLTLYWTPVSYRTVRDSGLSWEPGTTPR